MSLNLVLLANPIPLTRSQILRRAAASFPSSCCFPTRLLILNYFNQYYPPCPKPNPNCGTRARCGAKSSSSGSIRVNASVALLPIHAPARLCAPGQGGESCPFAPPPNSQPSHFLPCFHEKGKRMANK